MSARFPAPCPSGKMIAGSHDWQGFAGFNFPGFKGTFSGQSWSGDSQPSGGSWAGGAPALSVGDLVLTQANPAIGGTAYAVYKVTMAIPSGWTLIDPQLDAVVTPKDAGGNYLQFPNIVPATDEWTYLGGDPAWTYTLTGLISGLQYSWTCETEYPVTINGTTATSGTFTASGTTQVITTNDPLIGSFDPPTLYVANNVVIVPTQRHFTIWDYLFYVNVSVPNIGGPTGYSAAGAEESLGVGRELFCAGLGPGTSWLELTITDDFSALAGLSGSPGSDTVVRTWTVNKYDGSIATTGPTPTPTTAESGWMFPALPPPTGSPTYTQPLLISLDNSGPTSLVFTFGWVSTGGVLNAFTQTLALSSEYDLSAAFTDTTTLLSAAAGSLAGEFALLNWGQLATCTYNSDGSVHVVVSSIATTGSIGTGCSDGAPGGATATTAAAYATTQITEGYGITESAALVDVCGNYCLRTFHCTAETPIVDCTSGNVDGYAPVTIDPPALPSGETAVWTYLFPNCVCV